MTALARHLAKEAAHLVPLLNGHFTPQEQAELVSRFIASIPAGWVGPVLARGPTTGEQGPLRTLLASWLGGSGSNVGGWGVKNNDDNDDDVHDDNGNRGSCLLYTSPSPRDATLSRMPSSA